MEPLNNKGGGGNTTLEIHVHHARNIHNICIYEKQDVYAKFSLTYDPDHTVSTPVVRGGGRNPDFHQDMAINVTHPDSILKCEIWMLSRAKHLMDDQLLGFALVPIPSLPANKSLTHDFHLSSTDLFHSPAGTIKLSLLLNTTNNHTINTTSSSHANEEDGGIILVSEEYCRMEFPDIRVAEQNREMVREYFVKDGVRPVRPWDGSFLQLGAGAEECEMAGNSSEGSSGMTSLGDDRNEEEEEEEAMQKQIVEMYVRSMRQFTESLAKMKLPMDLDKDGNEEKEKKKQDSGCSRVFYGSRAFF
ncbi:hypothetical protein SASPL_129488 [Salvia splendens]|uniref:C2 domain-containing protein n=1 Tax=Salvia splendens TaxID=180675 RepID=A0A8X8XH86_SALSN|nr:uncharacterized protein LOC121750523 [Salvia splendens]KAG6411406.1 hypothetical protein SASPL_129488 [Salvia splendens]